jgi:hypothetical protein
MPRDQIKNVRNMLALFVLAVSALMIPDGYFLKTKTDFCLPEIR